MEENKDLVSEYDMVEAWWVEQEQQRVAKKIQAKADLEPQGAGGEDQVLSIISPQACLLQYMSCGGIQKSCPMTLPADPKFIPFLVPLFCDWLSHARAKIISWATNQGSSLRREGVIFQVPGGGRAARKESSLLKKILTFSLGVKRELAHSCDQHLSIHNSFVAGCAS